MYNDIIKLLNLEHFNRKIEIIDIANEYLNFNILRNRIMYSLNNDVPANVNPRR